MILTEVQLLSNHPDHDKSYTFLYYMYQNVGNPSIYRIANNMHNIEELITNMISEKVEINSDAISLICKAIPPQFEHDKEYWILKYS